jgi:hypothetical protein
MRKLQVALIKESVASKSSKTRSQEKEVLVPNSKRSNSREEEYSIPVNVLLAVWKIISFNLKISCIV